MMIDNEIIELFKSGKISSGRAAQLAGMERVQFLLALRDYKVAPFRLTQRELTQDVENA
ncbi:MAG: UPF0175 family protein [Thermoanaerobaculia bacterium]